MMTLKKAPECKGLREFREKHGYNINDLWLPRVTSVLQIVAKPGLLRYYAQQKNFLAAQEAMRFAAENGIKVHNATEDFLQGKPVHDKSLFPLLSEVAKWQKKHQVKTILVEEKVFDDKENYFCGTIDILAEIDGEIGILDIKTGSGIWEEYGLQTAAYQYGHNLRAPKDLKAQASFILRLDTYQVCDICGAKKRDKAGDIRVNGGKFFCQHDFNAPQIDLEFKKMKNYESNLKAFIHAKHLWEWANKSFLSRIKNYPKSDSL